MPTRIVVVEGHPLRMIVTDTMARALACTEKGKQRRWLQGTRIRSNQNQIFSIFSFVFLESQKRRYNSYGGGYGGYRGGYGGYGGYGGWNGVESE